MLAEIRGWVEIESPTTVPEAVNRMVDHVERAYQSTGARLERIPGCNGFGDHLIARSSWGTANRGILVLSHLDTVHPMGFIERLPFKVEGDIAYGPGIYDMKGGAFLAFHAFREMARDWTRLDFAAYAETFAHLAQHDAGDLLAKIETPTLIVAGGRDLLTPPGAAQRIVAAMPDAELVKTANCQPALFVR